MGKLLATAIEITKHYGVPLVPKGETSIAYMYFEEVSSDGDHGTMPKSAMIGRLARKTVQLNGNLALTSRVVMLNESAYYMPHRGPDNEQEIGNVRIEVDESHSEYDRWAKIDRIVKSTLLSLDYIITPRHPYLQLGDVYPAHAPDANDVVADLTNTLAVKDTLDAATTDEIYKALSTEQDESLCTFMRQHWQ